MVSLITNSSVLSIRRSDNKHNLLFDSAGSFVYSSLPLIRNSSFLYFPQNENTGKEKLVDECFSGQVSFFKIAEPRPKYETINSIYALFNYYYYEWSKSIKYQSSIDIITSNDFFKKIIGLGAIVVPYIIEKLKDTPDFLIIALYKITGENPVQPGHCGKIKDMAEDWIEWWNKKNL